MGTPFVDKVGRIDGGVASVSKCLSDEFVKRKDVKITIVVPNAARNQVEQFGNITIYRIAKAIEWHKHQSLRRWIDIFSQAGYSLYDFRWSSLYPVGKLASNFWVQYLTTSHFVLRFQNR